MEDNLIFFLIASFILFFAILIFIGKRREEKEQKRQRHEEYRLWCEKIKKDFSHWLAQKTSSVHEKAQHPFMLWLAKVSNHFPGILPGETLNGSCYEWIIDNHYQLFRQFKHEYEQNILPEMQRELQQIERIKEYLAAPRILSQMHEGENFPHADIPATPQSPETVAQPEPVEREVPRPSRSKVPPPVHATHHQPPTATADILRILFGVKITLVILLPIMYLFLPKHASRSFAAFVLAGCGLAYLILTTLCIRGYVLIPNGFENNTIFRLYFYTESGGVARALRKYYSVIQWGDTCKILSNISSSLSVLIFLGVFSGLWWMGAVAALAFVYAAQFVSPRLDPMWFLGERSRGGDRTADLELLDLVQAKQGHDDCLVSAKHHGYSYTSLAVLIRQMTS